MSTLVAGAERAPIPRFARTLRRAARRVVDDPHVLLAIGLTAPTVLVHLGLREGESPAVVAVCLLYVAVQTILSTAPTLGARIGSLALPSARLVLAVLFVTAVTNQTGDAGFRPLTGLYIPVVTMAAAYGGREARVVGALAAAGYFGPAILSGEHVDAALQRGLVLLFVSVILVVGTRRTVSSLEQALHRLRQTMGDARRRSRQVEAVEAVGRALAARGPEAETLEQVMDLLHQSLGYSHVSIYLVDGGKLRLGAQRGYSDPIEVFDGSVGVIGRVVRNGGPS